MATNDVKTLFRRFGGNASVYQEIVSRDQVVQAEEKWPMLGQIKPTTPHEAPSARRVGSPSFRRIQNEDLPVPEKNSSLAGSNEPLSSLPDSRGEAQGQGLDGVFQSLLPSAHMPTGPAERVSQRNTQPVPAAQTGLFAGFLDKGTAASQKTFKSASTANLLGGQSRLLPQAGAPKNPVDLGVDTVLGRKLGAQSHVIESHLGKEKGFPLGSTGISKAETSPNKQKNNELQQIFGKMMAQPDPPVHVKKEGAAAKRPTKW